MTIPTIAVVGSSTFPLARGSGHILRKMNKEHLCLPQMRFASRADRSGVAIKGVDSMTRVFAHAIGGTYVPVWLDSTVKAEERGLRRDMRLVDESQMVWAFFDPQRVMQGGTANVVNIAINKGVEVAAWTLDEDDNLIEVGSLSASLKPVATFMGSKYTGSTYIAPSFKIVGKPITTVTAEGITFTVEYDEVS